MAVRRWPNVYILYTVIRGDFERFLHILLNKKFIIIYSFVIKVVKYLHTVRLYRDCITFLNGMHLVLNFFCSWVFKVTPIPGVTLNGY